MKDTVFFKDSIFMINKLLKDISTVFKIKKI